jgi:hypothetical protein
MGRDKDFLSNDPSRVASVKAENQGKESRKNEEDTERRNEQAKKPATERTDKYA